MKKVLGLLFLLISFSGIGKTVKFVSNNESKYRIVMPSAPTPNEFRALFILREGWKVAGWKKPVVVGDSVKPSKNEICIGFTNRSETHLQEYSSECIDQWMEGNRIFLTGGGRGVIYSVADFMESYLGLLKLSPGVIHYAGCEDVSFEFKPKFEFPASPIRIINGPHWRNDLRYRDWRRIQDISDVWSRRPDASFFVHTFNKLVAPADYFKEHPEYFSQVNGKRIPFGQLCLSNPEVLQICKDKLRVVMEENPAYRNWSVSQNDCYYNCECEKCHAIDSIEGSPAGIMIRFVNELAKEFPHQTISTLAYQYTRRPPKITKPLPNVMVTLCTIELDRCESIDKFPGSASFLDDIKGWSSICNNLMLWDYTVQFTNYLCPFPNLNVLQPNIQLFDRNHVTTHFQQGNSANGVEWSDLKDFLISHWLWNPNYDQDSLTRVFLKAYYGSAAPMLYDYIQLIHAEAKRSNARLDIYGNPVQQKDKFLTYDLIETYKSLFDEAEKAVDGDSALLSRVRIARMPIIFSELEIAKNDLFGPRGFYTKDSTGKFQPKVRFKLIDELYSLAKLSKMEGYNENGLTPEKYDAGTRRFVNVQVEGNKAFQKQVTLIPSPAPQYTHEGGTLLTNGVCGTDDWKINWLGWEGKDAELILDLGKVTAFDSILLTTLQFPKSWIIHPTKVEFLVSNDSISFKSIGVVEHPVADNVSYEIGSFRNDSHQSARYIKVKITASKMLPEWHAYHGNKSWLFVDELIVR